MLQSATEDSLFSQFTIDLQLPSHIVDKKDKYKMKEILNKKIIQQHEELKKKYLIK